MKPDFIQTPEVSHDWPRISADFEPLVWSLLDMIRFKVHELVALGINSGAASGAWLFHTRDLVPSHAAEQLLPLVPLLSECGLRSPLLHLQRVVERVRSGTATGHEYVDLLNQLGQRIADDLAAVVFMRLESKRAAYFDDPNALSELVPERFPSTKRDIREVGRCYAAGRNTATVYHLMRVMEVGLKALGKQFGVPDYLPSWESILHKIEHELEKDHKDKTPEWKAEEECYRRVISDFRAVKDAWRNYVMHARVFYDDETALEQIHAVKAFMRHLAEKFGEGE